MSATCYTCRRWRRPNPPDPRMPLLWGHCTRAAEAGEAPLHPGTLAQAADADGRVCLLWTAPSFGCVQHDACSLPAGSVITCEAGHEVCDVARTIRLGDDVMPEHFGLPREGQPPFVPDGPIGPCRCGAPFASDAGRLHTAGGWVPDRG